MLLTHRCKKEEIQLLNKDLKYCPDTYNSKKYKSKYIKKLIKAYLTEKRFVSQRKGKLKDNDLFFAKRIQFF